MGAREGEQGVGSWRLAPCSRAALLLTGCLLVALSSWAAFLTCLGSASPHVPRFPSGSGHSPIGFFRRLVLACAGGVRLAFVLLFPLAFAFPAARVLRLTLPLAFGSGRPLAGPGPVGYPCPLVPPFRGSAAHVSRAPAGATSCKLPLPAGLEANGCGSQAWCCTEGGLQG